MDEEIERNERRQRKKQLINEVKDILEFYFSPPNLSKSAYLSSLISKDPYIDLKEFLKFNKLKNATQDLSIIKKSIGKRIEPAELKLNETECTIYVENLPIDVSREWIRKIFSQYGAIDYISLPCFSKSKKPKGFAFVEFHTPEEACQALVAFGGLAMLDGSINPADLLSIKSFGKEEKSDVVEYSFNESKEKDEANKSKRSRDESNGSEFISVKKRKIDDNEEEFKSEGIEMVKIKEKIDNEKGNSQIDTEDKEKNIGDVIDLSSVMSKKKKRKRRKKEKEYESNAVFLRVLSKKDWKKLRNTYLNEQRNNLKMLKKLKYSMRREYAPHYADRNDEIRAANIEIIPPPPNKPVKLSTKPEFVEGIIVKITLDSAPEDSKSFRLDLTKNFPSIAYVDISEFNKDVFIRFRSAEGSMAFVNSKMFSGIELMTGQEEKDYWKRIVKSWESRRPKKIASRDEIGDHKGQNSIPLRGKDKLIKKALKKADKQHIIFDD